MKIDLQLNRRARIEMLPLIDIVFLLLVFFIYAMLSMAVHRGLPVELPSSVAAEIDKKLVLSLTIMADETIYLDKEPLALEDLTEMLKRKAAGDKEPGVLIFADRGLGYQKLYNVLDKIRLAGINRISLQAEFEQNQ